MSLFRFSERAGSWRPVPDGPLVSTDLGALRVVTYNVWFGPLEQLARRHAVLAILEDADADVVVLPEVTAPFLAGLLAADFVRERYEVSAIAIDPMQRYDVVVLSALPARLAVTRFRSLMGRGLFTLAIPTPAGPLLVAGTHLESTSDQQPTRLEQLDRTLEVFGTTSRAVLLGDLNFEPGTLEDARLCQAGFVDAWSMRRPDEPGYTRDSDRNGMVARLGTPKHRRIDHVYLRGPGLRCTDIRLLGVDPIDTQAQVWPSDHFGLVADLAFEP